MEHTIGVIGSAAGNLSKELLHKARAVGKEIAKHNCILMTGSSPGISYEAVKGAKEHNGFVVGFSPALNVSEHVEKYKFPIDFFDILIYTGFGLKGRNVVFMRSCDAVVVISGRIGTLNEFTIAYDEKKVIGVLEETGGTSDKIKEIVRSSKKAGGRIIFHNDPTVLVKELIKNLQTS